MRRIRGIIPGVGAAFFGNFARLRGICCRRVGSELILKNIGHVFEHFPDLPVLIRTPGILSPLLRRLFGIRRQKPGR